jgi:hypothetical protein
MRTATVIVMATAWLVVLPGAATATTVYWTPAHELAPPPQYLSLDTTWGDLDGDEDVDVSSLRQFWNDAGCPGTPLWRSEARVLASCPNCIDPAATLGDLDADGDLDLVYGCSEPGLRMFWNVGTSHLPQWQQDLSMFDGGGGSHACPRLADLDADGDLDLVVVTSGGGTWLRQNVGTPQVPQWGAWQIIPIGQVTPTGSGAAGDLDGDGDLDLVTVSPEEPLRAWENVGTPQAWQFVENPAMLTGVNGPDLGGGGLALPDVDCDGDPDLLVCSWGLHAYLYLNERASGVAPTSWGTIKALYR